jgi:hypothetical protein
MDDIELRKVLYQAEHVVHTADEHVRLNHLRR